MAHDLAKNEKTGKAAYMGIEPAWHGLGTVLGKPATAAEALEIAGLDFEVIQAPATYQFGDTEKEIKDKKINIRSDNGAYLGTVGKIYKPLQNRDAFSFFDSLVDADNAIYHTAGALGVGERIWILAKLPHIIRIGTSDDVSELYVLIYNSHNGKSSITACMTPVRVVCNNTLTAALNGVKHQVKIRHTTNATEKLKEAHKILGISTEYKEAFEQVVNAMAHKKVKTKDINLYLDALYPKNPDTKAITQGDKNKAAILDVFESGIGQDMPTTKGTVYGMYNAVTYWLDHTKDYKSNNSKLKSVWFGGSKLIRQKAFSLAAELVQ